MLAADSPVDARPTPHNAIARDAAPFDSVPGAGFDTNPMAAAIVPPKGTLTAGAHLSISPQETNAFRALNAAWKAGASVGRRGDRYIISGLSESAMSSWSRHLRSRASGWEKPAIRFGSRESACSSRRTAWTRAGPGGCSSATGSSS